MKNLGRVVSKSTILTCAVGLFLLAQHPVQAQSDSSNDGAVVLHGCPDTFTSYGKSKGYIYSVCADIVFTPAGNVNGILHGALLDPATAPSHAVVVRDFPCEYNGQVTYDSEIVITPDGNVEGRCALHTN